ncbi:uncharacterized protein PG986_012036 [Apiospora aurea]|uniref:Uncharacterized protein n=1 Tax=Apiospora aurea TaxID=335848 RepID=A0ABR1PYW7_9PEZI
MRHLALPGIFAALLGSASAQQYGGGGGNGGNPTSVPYSGSGGPGGSGGSGGPGGSGISITGGGGVSHSVTLLAFLLNLDLNGPLAGLPLNPSLFPAPLAPTSLLLKAIQVAKEARVVSPTHMRSLPSLLLNLKVDQAAQVFLVALEEKVAVLAAMAGKVALLAPMAASDPPTLSQE